MEIEKILEGKTLHEKISIIELEKKKLDKLSPLKSQPVNYIR